MFAAAVILAFVLAACSGGGAKQVVASKSNASQDDTSVTFPEETTTTEAPVTTTTVAPTTTTIPVPTTMGPFSVKSVSITMGECHDGYPHHGMSGATYGCVGSFVAKLNPGIGGTMKWNADWMWWIACNQEEYSSVRTTNGSIDVPTGATQVEGLLEIYSETPVNSQIVNGNPAKFTPTVQVTFTEGGTGSSPKTPFWGEQEHCLPGV